MMREDEVLASIEGLTLERLTLCVSEALIQPLRDERGQLFDALDLARIRLIVELREELEVNDEAIPIILSLIDQMHGLKRQLVLLDKAICDEQVEVRNSIDSRLRDMIARSRSVT